VRKKRSSSGVELRLSGVGKGLEGKDTVEGWEGLQKAARKGREQFKKRKKDARRACTYGIRKKENEENVESQQKTNLSKAHPNLKSNC